MGHHAAARDPDPAFDPARGTAPFALTPREHRRLAQVLLKAERDQSPIVPLSRRYPELTIADARKIRDLSVESRVAAGERIVGAKISLAHPGEDAGAWAAEPRLGWLTEGMLLDPGSVELAGLIRPRVQPKVALRLARPLRGALATVGELAASIERVIPCLEIVDERYAPSTCESVDAIADNCAAAGIVLGEGIPAPPELELRRLRVEVHIESRAGDSAFRRTPHPCSVETALWLANRVVHEGRELEAGGLLVSAGCGPSMYLRAGGRVEAEFGSLGGVSIRTNDAQGEV